MRKIIIYMLSLVMVFAPAIAANAASSWSITSAVSAGSRTVVSASKAGYKSAVNIAPTAGRLSLKLVKGANWAAIAYAAIQLAPDLADISSFQPQYSQNRVTYITPPAIGYRAGPVTDGIAHKTRSAACASGMSYLPDDADFTYTGVSGDGYNCRGTRAEKGSSTKTPVNLFSIEEVNIPSKPGYIEMDKISKQMMVNAAASHAPSQEAVRATATEMVVAGDFDADLLSGAVPTNDSRPLVPSVPISGNGNVAPSDSSTSGATPGEQASSAQAAADAAKAAAAAAAQAAKDAAEEAQRAADDAQDVINSAVDQAIKDIAAAKAAAAAQAAKDAAAVSDAAKAAAAAAAKDYAAAAAQAAKAAAKALADAKAAADATAETIAAAQAVADTALAAAKAAKEAAEAAKAEAVKPFELPAFCSWAAPVCDAIDWLKRDPSDVAPMPVDVEAVPPTKSANEFDVNYVSFGGQCPVLPSFNVGVGSVSTTMQFDVTPLCDLAVMIRPAIIAISYFIGLGVIASAIRET